MMQPAPSPTPRQRPDYWKHDLVPGGEHKDLNTLNLGPTHPATHGIFQNVLTMDGEVIQSAEQTIGPKVRLGT